MSYAHIPMTDEEIMQALADGDEAVRRNPHLYVDKEFPSMGINNKDKKNSTGEWCKHHRKIGKKKG
jgi:hypothetical protein